MKIALYASEFMREDGSFPGGLAVYIYKISHILAKQGHQVHLFIRETYYWPYQAAGIECFPVRLGDIPKWIKVLTWLPRKASKLLDQQLKLAYGAVEAMIKVQQSRSYDILQGSNGNFVLWIVAQKINIPVLYENDVLFARVSSRVS